MNINDIVDEHEDKRRFPMMHEDKRTTIQLGGLRFQIGHVISIRLRPVGSVARPPIKITD